MLHRAINRARQAHRADGGFTLIELLLVIVILGVLSAIVVFSVRGITDRGDTAACKSNVKAAQVAVEAYYAQENKYPTTITQLTSNGAGSHKLLQEAPPTGILTFGATSADEPTYKSLSAC